MTTLPTLASLASRIAHMVLVTAGSNRVQSLMGVG